MNADSTLPQTRVRAGGTVLSLLAGPLCAPILRAHLDGPLRLPNLREHLGGAAQTTLRGQIGNLRAIGALERHVTGGMPYTVENELTDAGRGILAVADLVEAWLSRAPQGPIAFGGEAAKGAIRALVAGWGSTILRAVATRPLALTELDGLIPDMSYPAIERRLTAMRAARQVEAMPSPDSQGKPYAVTEWTRWAAGPLVAAGRCEHEHLAGQAEPLTPTDTETALLLAVPLVDLPANASGSCLLVVADRSERHAGERPVGVEVEVERGAVVSCALAQEGEPGAWATGDVESWVAAILDGRIEDLEIGGDDAGLAGALVESVHAVLP